METVNKKIAVEPFPTVDTKTTVKHGRVELAQRQALTRLMVVFKALEPDLVEVRFNVGDYVYVRGDLCKHQLAKEIYELEGKRFILIDESMIVGFDVRDCENPDGN